MKIRSLVKAVVVAVAFSVAVTPGAGLLKNIVVKAASDKAIVVVRESKTSKSGYPGNIVGKAGYPGNIVGKAASDKAIVIVRESSASKAGLIRKSAPGKAIVIVR
ncbi:MAG: hypothetical protein ACRCWQ_08330 [Bacilli bacterium]